MELNKKAEQKSERRLVKACEGTSLEDTPHGEGERQGRAGKEVDGGRVCNLMFFWSEKVK